MQRERARARGEGRNGRQDALSDPCFLIKSRARARALSLSQPQTPQNRKTSLKCTARELDLPRPQAAFLRLAAVCIPVPAQCTQEQEGMGGERLEERVGERVREGVGERVGECNVLICARHAHVCMYVRMYVCITCFSLYHMIHISNV